MATTIADIKQANSNAKRTSYQISAETMTRPAAVQAWLRQIAQLEAAVRNYAREHGVDQGWI